MKVQMSAWQDVNQGENDICWAAAHGCVEGRRCPEWSQTGKEQLLTPACTVGVVSCHALPVALPSAEPIYRVVSHLA